MINNNARLAFVLLLLLPGLDINTVGPNALPGAVAADSHASSPHQLAIAEKGSPPSREKESARGPTTSSQKREVVKDSTVPISVSLVALLSRPELYAGMRVRTQGFLTLEFEGPALHLTEADWDAGVTLNALHLAMLEEDRTRRKDCHLSYVTITATFSPDDKGPHHLYSGSLNGVTDIWRNVTHKRTLGEHDGKCGSL